MKTITIQVPEVIDLNEKEAAMIIASKLYEQGKISMGQGADMAGYSKRTFMELLGRYNVSIFNYDFSEIEQEIKNAFVANHHY